MKRKLCTALMSICFVLFVGIFAGCGESKYTLSIENDVTTLKPGESTRLILNAEDMSGIEFKINDGEEWASIVDGVLKINTSALPGEEVEVVAVKDGKNISNEVEIIIASINLVSLTAECSRSEILPNGFVNLTYTATPANTTEAITWKIIEGDDIADIVGNRLMVSENASAGDTIKVKAVGQTKSSNELTFTVAQVSGESLTFFVERPAEIDASKAIKDNIIVTVFNGVQEVTGQEIEYSIVEGEEYIALEEDGNTCALTAIGHGNAKVRITLKSTNESKDYVIKCIKAPDAIVVHEALQDKKSIELHSAKNQDINNFGFEIIGTNVCQDLEYKFEKYDETEEEYIAGDFGTYSDGKLKFVTEGKIRVTATSKSGSVSEKSASVVFNVNDGINVSTFEEFKTAMQNSIGKPINILNMNKINDEYKYNLVPSIILNNAEDENTYSQISIIVQGKNIKLNGNGYSIDLSKMKYFENYTDDYGSFIKIQKALDMATYEYGKNDTVDQINAKKRTLSQADYSVDIRDFNLIGNTSVDGSIGTEEYTQNTSLNLESLSSGQIILRSSYRRAIDIGGDRDLVAYHVNINNVDIRSFQVGLRICHAVGNSKVSNTRLSDCFANGVESCSNMITFENMTYGPCGAAGIEISPDSSVYSGFDFSEDQTVTFAGTINTTNITNVNTSATVYLTLFAQSAGAGLSDIVMGAMMEQSGGIPEDEIIANVMTEEQDIVFIALLFNGETLNTSVVNYSSDLNNGIVDFADLEANDEHKYVRLPLPSASGFGSILLLNLKYLED